MKPFSRSKRAPRIAHSEYEAYLIREARRGRWQQMARRDELFIVAPFYLVRKEF